MSGVISTEAVVPGLLLTVGPIERNEAACVDTVIGPVTSAVVPTTPWPAVLNDTAKFLGAETLPPNRTAPPLLSTRSASTVTELPKVVAPLELTTTAAERGVGSET